MTAFPAALALGVGDLADRRVLGILGRSLAITLLIFAAIGGLIGWGLHGVDPCAWFGEESGPLDAGTSGVGAVLLMLLGIWLLFPAVAIGVISAYADRIVAAVEARHYPAAAASARSLGIGGSALLGLRSSLRLLLFNLVALPFYILMLVTGIGPLILFVLVNGVAVGRDFGEMVSLRHLDRDARRAWLRATRGDRAGIGIAASALFLVPFANLVAPVIGAAAAAHLFHRSTRSGLSRAATPNG